MEDCLFCKIVAGEIPSERIAESEGFVAFLDINPVSKGHALIVPKTHSTDLLDMSSDLGKEFLEFSQRVGTSVVKAVGAQGFNLGLNNGKAAGQVIWHTHFHLIPRFENDGLEMWPSHGSTPGELAELKETIAKHF